MRAMTLPISEVPLGILDERTGLRGHDAVGEVEKPLHLRLQTSGQYKNLTISTSFWTILPKSVFARPWEPACLSYRATVGADRIQTVVNAAEHKQRES